MNPNIQSLIGHEINEYHIEGLLGDGLTGVVFRAVKLDPTASTPAQPIALKVFFPATGVTPEERANLFRRFEQEATILKNLRHPNILAILDYGHNELYTYIALPLATGGTLADRMAMGLMPLPEVLRLLRQIAAGLDYAHQQRVIHRDIKPSNILLDAQNNALIGDFSIAKQLDSPLTTSISQSNIMGTFQYMAPEQLDINAIVGSAADRYSLAVVTYQLLTGEVPFRANSTIQIFFNQLINQSPPQPRTLRADLPEPADAVIMKALNKAPGDRFPSATAFVEALALGLQNQWPANVTPFVAATQVITGPLPTQVISPNASNGPTLPIVSNNPIGGQSPTATGPLQNMYPPYQTGPMPNVYPQIQTGPIPTTRSPNTGLIAALASALLVLMVVFVLFGLGIIPPKGSTTTSPVAGGTTPAITQSPPTQPAPTATFTPVTPATNTPVTPPTNTPVTPPTNTPVTPPTSTPVPPPTNTPIPSTTSSCLGGFNCIDDAQISYFGTWKSDVGQCTCYNGTQHYTGTTWGATAGNSSAAVGFNGSQIIYYAVVDNHHGFMALYLDGNFAGNVDLYSPNRQGFVQVWNSGTLATGNHVLRLVFTNTRDGSSSDTVVTIDAFAYR